MAARTEATMTLPAELMSTEQLKEAWLHSAPIEFGDPIQANTILSHHQTYFPLGFPVTIATNSREVLQAADQCWGRFTQLFERDPIQLRICVSAGDSSICPPNPTHRMHNHLITKASDSDNFGVCDLSRKCATLWVTEAALRHRDYFLYCWLESTAMCNISGLYATGIHAGCVALNGAGVLLCGDSGAGKSSLSYACARAGWTYTTDDGSYLVHGRKDRLVVGNSRQVRFRESAEELFPELRGLPVMQRAGVGKPSVELSTDRTSIFPTACVAYIQHIVFLKRGVQTQELAAFPRAVARLYMQQRVLCMPYDVEPQMQAIDRLLELDTCELRYNDLDWAIERLSQMVGRR